MAVPLPIIRRAAVNYLLRRVYCVSFELTYNCNASCQHCHRGPDIPKERLASPDRLVEICQQIRPVVSIMSGGEPLIRKELDEIVHGLKASGASSRVNVNTNAALLTPKRFAELKAAGIDNFVVSFDFPDERHDEWRAIPGLFSKIKHLIEGLSPEDRRRVALTGVFTSKNYREAPRMAEVAREWGVTINFSTYTWLRTDDKSLLIPKEEMSEFRAIVGQLVEMRRAHGHVLTSDRVFAGMIRFFENREGPRCDAGERLLVVNPDGTFSPCGLIIRDYPTRQALLRDFTKNNTCTACYTSSRAASELPLHYLVLDHIHQLNSTGPSARA